MNCNIEPECRIKRYVFRCVCCELFGIYLIVYTLRGGNCSGKT